MELEAKDQPAWDWDRFCPSGCTFEEVNLFQLPFRWAGLGMVLVLVWVPLAGLAGAFDPWAGMVVVLQYQFLAMQEDVGDGQDSRSGFVEVADQAATAAVTVRTDRSAPMPQLVGRDVKTGWLGMRDAGASHVRLHCSVGMVQEDIRDLPDSAVQDSGDVGVESAAAQTARRSALPGSPD